MASRKKLMVIGLGLVGVGITALAIKNKKALESKPDLFIRDSLPGNFNALTLPPIGIFVRRDQAQNAALLNHELVHWKQYQQMGLLRYYATYAGQYFRDGYDKMAMELEARSNETTWCQENYTECVRRGMAATVNNPNFRV